VQIPTTWSATSITFTANQGTFTGTDNIWAFVVDSTGAVSPGLSVSGASGGGGVADTTPPSVGMTTPSNGAGGVSPTTSIVFVASDEASGVDLNSLTIANNVSVNNVNMVSGLACVGNKTSVTCTLDNADLGNFQPGQTVNLGVHINDLSSNGVLYTASFTVLNNTINWGGQTFSPKGQTLTLAKAIGNWLCGTAYADEYDNINIDYKISDALAESLNSRNPIRLEGVKDEE
jgi:hypothetical protein